MEIPRALASKAGNGKKAGGNGKNPTLLLTGYGVPGYGEGGTKSRRQGSSPFGMKKSSNNAETNGREKLEGVPR